MGEGFRERADPRLHQPGQRAEDLQLPHRAGQVGEQLRDEPALADRLRAVQADLVQRHHRCILLRAEPHVQRTARESPVQLRGSAVHLRRRSVQRHQEPGGRRRSRPAGGRAADLDAEGDRLQLLRHAGLRRLLRGLQLPGQDRRLQQGRRSAVLPAGDAAPGGPARPDQGLPQRGRRPGLHDDLAATRRARSIPRTRRRTRTRSACPPPRAC